MFFKCTYTKISSKENGKSLFGLTWQHMLENDSGFNVKQLNERSELGSLCVNCLQCHVIYAFVIPSVVEKENEHDLALNIHLNETLDKETQS